MPLDTFANLKFWLMSQADEGLVQADQDSSDLNASATTALIEAWDDVIPRHPWLDLQKNPPGVLLAKAPVLGLTLTAAAGLNVVGTLSASQSIDLTNYKVYPAGSNNTIRVAAHTPPSASITLDAVPQALTAMAVTLYKDEYDLAADLGIFVDGLWTLYGQFVELKPEMFLRTEYPIIPSTGWPAKWFARIGKTRIRLSHYPPNDERLEYPYCYEPGDPDTLTGTLPFGRPLRSALVSMGLAVLMDMKSDARATKKRQEAEIKIDKAWEYDQRLRTGQFIFGPHVVRSGPYA